MDKNAFPKVVQVVAILALTLASPVMGQDDPFAGVKTSAPSQPISSKTKPAADLAKIPAIQVDGNIYMDAIIVPDSDGIEATITHSKGTVRVPISKIPQATLKRIGYDPEAEAAAKKAAEEEKITAKSKADKIAARAKIDQKKQAENILAEKMKADQDSKDEARFFLGRLGESSAKFEKRFGKPSSTQGNVISYWLEEYQLMITTTTNNKKVTQIAYTRLAGLTKDVTSLLFESNKSGGEWKDVKDVNPTAALKIDMSGADAWLSGDSNRSAIWNREHGVLTFAILKQ